MPAFQRQTYGKFGLVITGIEELSRQLARDGPLWQRLQRAAIRGMIQNTEDLLGRSMRDAPVREGPLRASGHAAVYANRRAVARRGLRPVGEPTTPEQRQFEITARQAVAEGGLGDAVVGEVGFNMPYALVQHERLDFHHPKGGKAKYLEQNLKDHAEAYQRNLAARIREALT